MKLIQDRGHPESYMIYHLIPHITVFTLEYFLDD